MTAAPFLCEHTLDRATRRAFRLVCPACQSYWDLDSRDQVVPYDESYPTQRGHYDPRIGALKVRTLEHWLRKGRVDFAGKRVCEVGFGGGSCLPLLAAKARSVVALEANDSAIDHAQAVGYTAEFLLVQRLPARLAEPVDLWIFQDSFEHIPDPAAFVAWMCDNSSAAAEILLVAPRADSFSQRVLGRLWPHKLPDHQFQWSRSGVVQFMERRGFALRSEFFPLKFASPQMIVAHFLHKAGAPPSVKKWLGGAALAVPINFGEMGLVFRRAGA